MTNSEDALQQIKTLLKQLSKVTRNISNSIRNARKLILNSNQKDILQEPKIVSQSIKFDEIMPSINDNATDTKIFMKQIKPDQVKPQLKTKQNEDAETLIHINNKSDKDILTSVLPKDSQISQKDLQQLLEKQ